MNNKITITAFDGKTFSGNLGDIDSLKKEVNAYEANLKLKKEKEEAARKEKEKQEEEFKKTKESKLKELNDLYSKFTTLSNEYMDLTNEYLYFSYIGNNKYELISNNYTRQADDLITEIMNRFKY